MSLVSCFYDLALQERAKLALSKIHNTLQVFKSGPLFISSKGVPFFFNCVSYYFYFNSFLNFKALLVCKCGMTSTLNLQNHLLLYFLCTFSFLGLHMSGKRIAMTCKGSYALPLC